MEDGEKGEKERWAETMFKRLWWQKYKGHVGLFDWPTLTTIDFIGIPIDGLLKYDRSEQMSWNSAKALKVLLESLYSDDSPYKGKVRVLAHSQGNVVTGEAIKLALPGTVHTYIASQAAIPANVYDKAAGPPASTSYDFIEWLSKIRTPNVYSYYYSGNAGSTDSPYLVGNFAKTNMVSYFNVQDFALDGWWPNNLLKPDDMDKYNYSGSIEEYDPNRPTNPDAFYQLVNCQTTYDPDNGGTTTNCEKRPLTLPEDTYEIFARCAQSRSAAFGATRLADGIGMKSQLDLQQSKYGYDKAHYSHSRQFRSNIIKEQPYWSQVLSDFGISVSNNNNNQNP